MSRILDLEKVEENLFLGNNEIAHTGLPNIFGGQIAAQSLKAAGLTVESERLPHSLHGYFLRPGERSDPVVFRVERDRDGRSFSARRVRAIQHGRVIFDLTASFHLSEPGPEMAPPILEDVPEPQACPPESDISNHPAVDSRAVGGVATGDGSRRSSPLLWVRCREPLDDYHLDHCCALAYMSDISSGFAGEEIQGHGGASIDMSMWFQGRVRADDWLLLRMWPVLAGGARGLYQGSIHDRRGSAGAMFTQQCLLRPTTVALGH
jgi:acyl-CoA thioesterase-2